MKNEEFHPNGNSSFFILNYSLYLIRIIQYGELLSKGFE